MKKRLSLVLATYGRSDDIGRFIASLEKQTALDFELLVVDQNPDDRVLPYIAQARQVGIQVQHLRQQTPNLSAARNLGLVHAQGDVIAFPDDDCWYEPGVVAAVLAAFNDKPEWRGVVADWVEQSQAHGGQPSDTLLSQASWRRFRDGDASSISLFLNTELLRQVGGFDARLGVGQWFGAGEETDLILTLLSTGAPLARCPAARVHHRYATAGHLRPDVNWRAVLQRARGTGALYAKHRLGWVVFMRGLLAPPVKALRPWQGLPGLRSALATSVGRLQGAAAWMLGWRK